MVEGGDETHREQENERKQKKLRMLEVQGLRAVVVGLPSTISPARLFASTGAKKAEAYYARVGDKRSAP